jgi:hypothetical protein
MREAHNAGWPHAGRCQRVRDMKQCSNTSCEVDASRPVVILQKSCAARVGDENYTLH